MPIEKNYHSLVVPITGAAPERNSVELVQSQLHNSATKHDLIACKSGEGIFNC